MKEAEKEGRKGGRVREGLRGRGYLESGSTLPGAVGSTR